jgi:hypothetical protein
MDRVTASPHRKMQAMDHKDVIAALLVLIRKQWFCKVSIED